ncbi:MAG: hypothetical protein QM576_15690 [Rhodopseudomonas sp.]|uniref:hypothetical protein n=1 Tax=Rhodopseudomonas sp. TaxID=1078 RepID=UPI0039E4378A
MTPKQTLIVWCLLGRNGQALQAEIRPEVDKKDREALVANGLISSAKVGRALGLKLEDKGWNWAGEHLGDELPKNYRVLQQWLGILKQYFESSGVTLAEFIGPAPEWPPAKEAKRKKKSPALRKPKSEKTEARDRPGAPSHEQLRERIEQAYLIITNGRRGVSVPLGHLREQLADLDRATVDAALMRIHKTETNAGFGRNDDPKSISPDEAEAAFSSGGDPYHFIWFQS